MTTVRDLAELVRAPAALSVPGDSLAGAAAAGWPAGARAAVLPVASTCLYWAGMALNDYADRHLDAVERPERPIPSGRVTPGAALALATGLTAAGVGAAALTGGRRAGVVAMLLAATVWGYDLSAKQGPLGAAAMASTRGLDVLLGAAAAGRNARAALLPAALVTAHTAAVTVLARGEVEGTTRGTASRCLATTLVVAGGAALAGRRSGRLSSVAAAACAGAYAVSVGRAQAAAAGSGDAQSVRQATGAGVRGLIWLQAALLAGRGAPGAAAALVASGPVARRAMSVVSAS